MASPSRAIQSGLVRPTLPTGPLDAITDVAGVTVGHITLHDDNHQPPIHTGVTVILPHQGDLFNEKLVAAAHTINGYGKASGFEQVREMGTIEAPIALTNTLCVGRAWDALVTWMLARHPEIGASGPSVNPVVAECNDSRLNDMRGRHVTPEHVLRAIDNAQSGPVEEGSVGAGTGMVLYGYKGGIGTASRRVGRYMLGALLLGNFGSRGQLIVPQQAAGQIQNEAGDPSQPGSVIIVLATDAPLTARQLGRLARRAALGLARTGSTVGSGSGDFVLAFSTAQRIPQNPPGPTLQLECLVENALEPLFVSVVETVQESVYNALLAARPVNGPDGYTAPPFRLERAVE